MNINQNLFTRMELRSGGWMNSEEQLAEAMAAVHRHKAGGFGNETLCPDCFDKEQIIILECPITDIPSPRYRPHDPHYLVGSGGDLGALGEDAPYPRLVILLVFLGDARHENARIGGF